MKTERAIELLHRLQDEQFDGIHGDERREALEMAVRALEQNLVQESGGLVQDLVNDCISRKQAVMKEFSDFVRKSNNSDFAPTPTWNDAVSLVGSMPSAQPVNYGSTKSDSSSQLKLNNDLISRKQAIDALDKHIDTFDAIDTNYLCGLRTAMSILKELPSAQPHGKWILDTFQIRCNRCNKLFSDNLFPSKYCPNCGSRMDGESRV